MSIPAQRRSSQARFASQAMRCPSAAYECVPLKVRSLRNAVRFGESMNQTEFASESPPGPMSRTEYLTPSKVSSSPDFTTVFGYVHRWTHSAPYTGVHCL